MKFRLLFITTIFVALTLFSKAFSGELTTDLSAQIAGAEADELIPVWIKLHRLEPVSQLKARSIAQTQTRAERHELVQKNLIEGHAQAQEKLVEHLWTLSKQGALKNIKQYWIGNIVAVEIKASELPKLAARDDIELIFPVVEPKLITPTSVSGPMLDPRADTIAANLSYVKADVAWGMGFTGAGRLICSFDTGVEGSHPALAARWKGLDGDSAAAWFDPGFNEKFPHTISSNINHGTHTMGTMTGHDNSIGYTTGIAPEAKWISAAVVDVPGASILDAFQWVADPDGNPNTLGDVPDVINHSWGYVKSTLECENIFFDLIENTEALGIVNIFAGGNAWFPNTIHNPANGDWDTLSCFAVGNLDATAVTPLRAGSSSQGPSDCSGGIKPNVMAPGTNIFSSISDGRYAKMTGTSMAAPHVTGLVALLRQKNPNATVDQIKEAILVSTQTDASWGAMPNNAYGWGAIDCEAALNYLSTNASDPATIRVYNFEHPPISPGDTVTGIITLQNLGADAVSVQAALFGSDPSLTVLDGAAAFGNINRNSSVAALDPVTIVVADTVTEGRIISLSLNVTGSSINQNMTLHFVVGNHPDKGTASHTPGAVSFSLSNYGILGLGPNSMFRADGVGFTFNSSSNDLWEGGVMIGTGPTQVSSGIHSYLDGPNMDFKPAAGGDMLFLEPGRSAAQESISSFSDDYAPNPIGVTIKQHSFSYEYPNDKFVIVRYTLENQTNSAINNLYFGLLLDWDLGNEASNAGGYDESSQILWMAQNTGSIDPVLSIFRGMKLIQGQQSGALTQSGTDVSYLKIWGGNGYTPAEKWATLATSIPATDPHAADQDDLFQTITAGPYNLAPGQVRYLTIAILAGNTMTELVDNAIRADILAGSGVDQDGDGLTDDMDNCPGNINPEQSDIDADGLGDVCDNCPNLSNANQANTDSDTYGNLCDNCPSVANNNQINSDDDSHGDACDNCPALSNPDQANTDNDALGNLCDNCPDVANDDQADSDGDGIGDLCNLPDNFRLYQNYPNPFNPVTILSFDLPEPTNYQVRVYNVLGQEVFQRKGQAQAGLVSVEFDAGSFASGVYLYEVTTERHSATKKMLLLK